MWYFSMNVASGDERDRQMSEQWRLVELGGVFRLIFNGDAVGWKQPRLCL
jgi:hypothetical protein